jgi:transcriptional regulator with XRE-family HTH domain
MNFKEVIKEKGIKQTYLASKLGLSDGLFSFYLSGGRTMPEEVKKKLTEILK